MDQPDCQRTGSSGTNHRKFCKIPRAIRKQSKLHWPGSFGSPQPIRRPRSKEKEVAFPYCETLGFLVLLNAALSQTRLPSLTWRPLRGLEIYEIYRHILTTF